MGGVEPMGVVISGEPEGSTQQTSVTLAVGPNRSGHGIPEDGWPLGAGYTHYKWRLDGGPWSAETPIATGMVLKDLAAGPHFVEAIGRRDSGTWQNDPDLGASGVVSRSRTWTVKGKQ